MTTINSAEALQTSSASVLKNNIEKTQQAEAMASSFAQQLATASSNVNASGVSSAANNLINAAQSGLNLSSATGLNNNELLSQSLKTGVQSQFTNLGNDIASSLIDAFTGQNNTISTDSETDSSTDAATDNDADASLDTTQAAATTNSATSESEATETDETIATDKEIVDAAKTADAEETDASSSIFPEFIQNLFADLSIFKTQNTTELTDVQSDNDENDTEQVTEISDEVTTNEQVAS
ncbi:hypothetical protein ACR30L_05080 [Psychromonas sp. PT13]|uniref:hypothetical protein n=1 Tax=Psychromonas sp. PT13 TaxID=3439547 RepID=UPI003EC055C7